MFNIRRVFLAFLGLALFTTSNLGADHLTPPYITTPNGESHSKEKAASKHRDICLFGAVGGLFLAECLSEGPLITSVFFVLGGIPVALFGVVFGGIKTTKALKRSIKLRRWRNETFKKNRRQIITMMDGYTVRSHEEYMNKMQESICLPSWSNSLKADLRENFDDYRNTRDRLDKAYLDYFDSWAKLTSEWAENRIALAREIRPDLSYPSKNQIREQLFSLTKEINPYADQKRLNRRINRLGIEEILTKDLMKIITNYYKSRREIDFPYSDRESAIIWEKTCKETQRS